MPSTAASSPESRVPRYRPGTPGASAIRLKPDDIDGIWTLSFGRFGWKDYETRGAILRIERGALFGGGSNFVYRGHCKLVGEAAISIHIALDRYLADPNFQKVTGINETEHFEMNCIADALSPDHFEGRLATAGRRTTDLLPEVRLTLIRFAPL